MFRFVVIILVFSQDLQQCDTARGEEEVGARDDEYYRREEQAKAAIGLVVQ